MLSLQDIDGKTPVHVAIENQHPVIISLLLSHPSLDLTLRDKNGLTPFASAMTTRNNKAAQAILNREPTAAEQVPYSIMFQKYRFALHNVSAMFCSATVCYKKALYSTM